MMLGPTTFIFHDLVAEGSAIASGFEGADAEHYKLSPAAFSRHMAAIDAGAQRAGRLIGGNSGDQRSALNAGVSGDHEIDSLLQRQHCLTFDDGGACSLEITAPLLDRFGHRGIFLIPTDFVGRSGFLTPTDIKSLRGSGHVIGVHSASHPIPISILSPDEIRSEWQRSRDALEQILGEQVGVGSVPGGFSTRTVEQAAADAGLRLLFTSEPTRRLRVLDSMIVAGRFSVTKATKTAEIRALVRDEWVARLKLRATWEAKSVAKQLLGPTWFRLRQRYFSNRAR